MSETDSQDRNSKEGSNQYLFRYKLASWKPIVFSFGVAGWFIYLAVQPFIHPPHDPHSARDSNAVWVWLLAAFFLSLAIKGLLRGGCIVDLKNRTVTQWW